MKKTYARKCTSLFQKGAHVKPRVQRSAHENIEKFTVYKKTTKPFFLQLILIENFISNIFS
jgi:hypothetical protein